MAGAGSGLWAAAVLSWLSLTGLPVYLCGAGQRSQILGPMLHLYMKSPLMWATLAFGVGEHDKQVGFPFHTNRPVLSLDSLKGSQINPLVA